MLRASWKSLLGRKLRLFMSARGRRMFSSAVSVGTAVFHDPSATARVHRELAAALAARGFSSLREAVGYAHR